MSRQGLVTFSWPRHQASPFFLLSSTVGVMAETKKPHNAHIRVMGTFISVRRVVYFHEAYYGGARFQKFERFCW